MHKPSPKSRAMVTCSSDEEEMESTMPNAKKKDSKNLVEFKNGKSATSMADLRDQMKDLREQEKLIKQQQRLAKSLDRKDTIKKYVELYHARAARLKEKMEKALAEAKKHQARLEELEKVEKSSQKTAS